MRTSWGHWPAVALALQLACSSPQMAWQPQPDLIRLEQQLNADLGDPSRQGMARRQLAWLCLLHDRQCERATQELATGEVVAPAVETALLRALLADGAADPAVAAQAWAQLASVLTGADPTVRAEAPQAATVALQRLGALLSVTPVERARGIANQREIAVAIAHGSPTDQFLRALSLPWLQNGDPAPFVVHQQPIALSPRLHTALRWSAAQVASQIVNRDLDSQAVGLPADATANSIGVYSLVAGQAGVYQVSARFSVPAGHWQLGVAVVRQALGWLDGQPWPTADGFSGAVAQAHTLKAGEHRLDLAIAVAEEGERLRLWLVPALQPIEPQVALTAEREAVAAPDRAGVAAPDRAGVAAPNREVVADAPRPDPATPVLQVLAVLADRLGPARLALTTRFGQSIAAELIDVALAGTAEEAGGAIDRVLSSLPQHTGAILLDIERYLAAGNAQLALQQSGRLPTLPATTQAGERPFAQPAMGRVDVQLSKSKAFLASGLADLAVEQAAAAAASSAGRCRPWLDALTLAVEAGRPDAIWSPTATADLAMACRDEALLVNGLTAVRALRAARADDAALLALLGPVSRRPARWREWAQHTFEEDRIASPAPPWALVGQWAPLWRQIQTAWQNNDLPAANQLLTATLLRPDLPLTAKQRAMQTGATAPWLPFVRDGAKVAAQADDPSWQNTARTAWLLDQEVVVLLPGGGAIRRVHQVLRVLTDEAAEAVGEIRVADGAELEVARTILPDGSLLAPADTSDKSSVSLRAVAAGCAVEYVQTVWVQPDDPASGATYLSPFLLQASDAPVRLAEFVVLAPKGVVPQFALSPSAPQPRIVVAGAWTAHIFATRDQPQAPTEPRAIRPQRAVPSVGVTVGADQATLLQPWDERLAAMTTTRTPVSRQWLQQLQAQSSTAAGGRGRWQWLATKIANEIENDHESGPPGDANAALARQKGDRAAVFYALASQAGADVCLVRANPLVRDGAAGPLEPADFTMQLVSVALPDGASLWYDPGLEGGIIDHVRSGLRGRSAWFAGCNRPERSVLVPALGAGLDRRDIDVQLQWLADGSVTAKVVDTLHGATGAYVRQWLQETGRADHPTLANQLAATAFPGLPIQFDSAVPATHGGPTVVRYSVTAGVDAQRRTSLDLALYPTEIGKNFAILQRRTTPMSFGLAHDLHVRLRVDNRGPKLAPIAGGQGRAVLLHWQRRAEHTATGLDVEFRLRAEAGVVHSDAYAQFAQCARDADAAEILRLTR